MGDSAGGGFKENEGIEYKERDSDDEVYDEVICILAASLPSHTSSLGA
jgi:hypothetical protein